METYVRTLLDVQQRFGALHDHDYPLYRAVWISQQAKSKGLTQRARSDASRSAVEDFKVGRVIPRHDQSPGLLVQL